LKEALLDLGGLGVHPESDIDNAIWQLQGAFSIRSLTILRGTKRRDGGQQEKGEREFKKKTSRLEERSPTTRDTNTLCHPSEIFNGEPSSICLMRLEKKRGESVK